MIDFSWLEYFLLHIMSSVLFFSVNVKAIMAATLPPITKSPSGSKQGYAVPAPKGPPSGKLKPLRKIGKTDREILFKQEVLRQQQPDLSKKQTSRYLHTIY